MPEGLVTVRVPLKMKEEMNRAIQDRLRSERRRATDERLGQLLRHVKSGFDAARAMREA